MNSMKKMSAALLAALMLTGACAQAETVTGTATGMGAVSVELTVEDGKITAATVDTSHETVGTARSWASSLPHRLSKSRASSTRFPARRSPLPPLRPH